MKREIICMGIVGILFLTNLSTLTIGIETKSSMNVANTPEYSSKQFKQSPCELLEPGDIIIYFINNTLDNNKALPRRVGHCRLFIEYNYTTKKYTFIEAASPVLKIEYTELELIRFAILGKYEKILIVKVNATQEQRQNAISFAELQIGKEFDFNYRRINKNHNTSQTYDKDANEWYCSELPWAAYYNCNNYFDKTRPSDEYIFGQGIDIDNNGWTKDIKDFRGNTHSFVAPTDILKDDDVQVLEIWQRTLYNIIYFRLNYHLFLVRIKWYNEKLNSFFEN
jgi:uncharacterized protein YycO